MKLKELIDGLSKLDGELEVVVASDAEGNYIKDFSGWGTSNYHEGDEEFTDDEDMHHYTEEEQEDFKPVLVLYPY